MTVIQSGRVGAPLDDSTTLAEAKYPAVRDRRSRIGQLASASRATTNGLQMAAQDLRAQVDEDKRRLGRLPANSAASAAQQVELDRDLEAQSRLNDQLAEAIKVSSLDQAALQAATSYMARALANGPLTMVPVPLPKGDQLEQLDKARASIAAKSKTLKSVRRSAMPRDEYLALGVANLREKASSAAKFSHDPKSGPRIYWDFAALDDADVSRAIPNLEGMVVKLGLDDLIDQLTVEVDRYYDTKVEMALDAKTKNEREQTLAAEILALERVEVELLLGLRVRGAVIAFRPQTDPRALLGIDGPPLNRTDRPDARFAQVGDY